jgi:ABC-type polysaccharide/polyol phosphate export permease
MKLLPTLLAKDFRRAARNPLPWLIHLAMPLLITALLGLAFGGGAGDGAGLGRIRFALVDEDDSLLTQFLRGGLNQGEGGKYLEPVFLDRATALTQLHDDQLSAVVVIPRGFTHDYLSGRGPVTLELIKNPARSVHPAVLEELLGALVTGLNALARNWQSELPVWREAFTRGADYRQVADLIVRTGEKLETLRRYLDPPLITYTKVVKPRADVRPDAPGPVPGMNLFGYLLAGLATMFLLFQANIGINDLYGEFAGRTFERYHTLHQHLLPFLVAKGVFVVVMLGLCAAIMLGGGGLLFGVHWRHPLPVGLLVLGFATFGAGFAALFAALVPDARRADALSNLAAMALGLAGGCAFPPRSLPAFLREHVTPLLPSAWLADGIRQLEFGNAPVDWPGILLRFGLVAAGLLGLAAWQFHRRFARGVRP